MDIGKLRSAFKTKYGNDPRVFRAPGRVNLIGEHTDYNDGFVLPTALDFATYVAAGGRNDRRIRVASSNFDREVEFDLDQPLPQTEDTWAKYVQGVGLILEREGYRLGGADLLIDSDVPIGAGLSSSAALEISTALALASLAGHKIDGMKLARIGQAAEHEFAGVKSGVMDQFAAVFGQENNALFLDCRSFEWSPIPLSNARFII
ncbi:MAG: galactokinase family protein, partial [Acidobacteriota bacterium]